MSGVYIPDMEMPKGEERVFLTLSKNGLFEWDENKLEYVKVYKFIELPPHEELVQRSDILRLFDENKLSAREAVMKAPTVLEANK